MGIKKHKCSECGKMRRRRYNDLCYNCYQKHLTIIRMPLPITSERIKKQLNKERVISEAGYVFFPKWMAGLKFKLIDSFKN